MAREIAAEAAASAPDPELPPVQRCWRCGLARGHAHPRASGCRSSRGRWRSRWSRCSSPRSAATGLDDAVARLGYGRRIAGWGGPAGRRSRTRGGRTCRQRLLPARVRRRRRAARAPLAVRAGVRPAGVGGAAAGRRAAPGPVIVGASGGVAALIGACVVLQPRAQVAIQLGRWCCGCRCAASSSSRSRFQALMAALHVPGTAWTAHLLGLALGAGGRRAPASAHSLIWHCLARRRRAGASWGD